MKTEKGRNRSAKKVLRRLALWTLVALIMAAIFCFSAQDSGESGALSDSVAGSLYAFLRSCFPSLEFGEWETLTYAVRKAAHFFCYLFLSTAAFFAFSCDLPSEKKSALFSFLLSVLYAVSDELHQTFVPGRAGRLSDVLIDASGSLCGLLLLALCLSFRRRKKRKKQ